MHRLASVITLAVALVSCQTAGVTYDKHTGKTVVNSNSYSISDGLLHSANATAGWSSTRGYQVAFEFLATGGSWVFFREVWSNGKQFPFTPFPGRVLGCSAGCSLAEGGNFMMSEAEFRRAAITGFEFKVLGSGGAVTGKLPAQAFQQVLELQKKPKPAS